MPQVHLVGGLRTCGAVTVMQGNPDVYVNDHLVAVDGDPNSHGDGQLNGSGGNQVYIHDKLLVIKGDSARPDDALHPDPAAADGSSDVTAG